MKNSSHSQNVEMSYLPTRVPFIGSLHLHVSKATISRYLGHTTFQNVSTMGRNGHALPGGQNLILIIANAVRENRWAVLCKRIRHKQLHS